MEDHFIYILPSDEWLMAVNDILCQDTDTSSKKEGITKGEKKQEKKHKDSF